MILRTIAAACERSAEVAAMVAGIHVEGPFLSPLDGYRGAHPLAAVRDPDWNEFRALQDASGGRIVLITLAPERPGAIEFIRRAETAEIEGATDGPRTSEALDVARALAQLPSEARAALVLCYVEGLSYAEIARARGVTINTVKTHLARAKRMMRELLSEADR